MKKMSKKQGPKRTIAVSGTLDSNGEVVWNPKSDRDSIDFEFKTEGNRHAGTVGERVRNVLSFVAYTACNGCAAA